MAETSDNYATALLDAAETKSEALRLERLAKRIYAACYIGEGGTVAEREAKARTNAVYQKAEDDWIKAEHDANVAEAKAEALRLRFETWRTKEASRRAEMNLQ